MMTKRQLARFQSAKAIIESLKEAGSKDSYGILFDSEIINPEQIIISDDSISVKFEGHSVTSYYGIYDEDSYYMSISDFKDNVKLQFKLIKYCKF